MSKMWKAAVFPVLCFHKLEPDIPDRSFHKFVGFISGNPSVRLKLLMEPISHSIWFFIVLVGLHRFAGVHYFGYYLLMVFQSFAYFIPHCFSYISLQFVQSDRFFLLPQCAHLAKHQSETRTWTTDLYVPEPTLLQPDIMIINKVWHMSPWHRSLDAHWLDQPWHLTLNKHLHQILTHTPTNTHICPNRLTEGEVFHTPVQMWTQGNVWVIEFISCHTLKTGC